MPNLSLGRTSGFLPNRFLVDSLSLSEASQKTAAEATTTKMPRVNDRRRSLHDRDRAAAALAAIAIGCDCGPPGEMPL